VKDSADRVFVKIKPNLIRPWDFSKVADRLDNLTIATAGATLSESRRLRQPAGATQPDPPCAG
jgi:hypothetical protein